MRIILASKSPRRRKLLEMLGLEFEVMPSKVDEERFKGREMDPAMLARKLARLKAEEVASRTGAATGPSGDEGGALVIGADTLVSFRGRIIGKARDTEDAFRLLNSYSGDSHEQITGICIINTRTGKVLEDHDVTRGFVRELSEEEVRRYVRSGEPMEGAGGYTPRAHPMLFTRFEGSWTNVIGLPMGRFVPLLGEALKERDSARPGR
jgi:septum formation protein